MNQSLFRIRVDGEVDIVESAIYSQLLGILFTERCVNSLESFLELPLLGEGEMERMFTRSLRSEDEGSDTLSS